MCKFSIITVCKNAGSTLEATITSLQVQSFKDFEYIIIDGQSKDSTHSILREYEDLIDRVVSEEDEGIYFAMNKGIQMATGEYVYFLNSGDQLYDHMVLERIAKEIQERSDDLIFGDTLKIGESSDEMVIQLHENVDRISLLSKTINHQALFAKRELFRDIGNFDTSFKIKADHDWILRCFNQSVGFRYVPTTIVKYSTDGYSVKNWNKFIKSDREKLLDKNYSAIGLFLIRALSKAHILPRHGYVRRLLNRVV